MRPETPLRGQSLFLSAGIPDPDRWDGAFDPLEITDAVVAGARALLTAGGSIVTALHPTIAPLLLYIAAEFPALEGSRITVYQSRLFENILPAATARFFQGGAGVFRWSEAVAGDQPLPGRWDDSLKLMRESMLSETDPVAAVFIGGMEGIASEYEIFHSLFPARRWYALGRPGGEARLLGERTQPPLWEILRGDESYPTMFRLLVENLLLSM
jgi:hypothetical protein